MGRLGLVASSLAATGRNADVRRVEIAWAAAVTAEWAHFVALGVFAYEHGGPAAVGVAGLVRLLPAALLAPFAASLGDRFRRDRFLLLTSVLAAAALAGSSAAAFAGNVPAVFALAAVLGVASTLVRPALQALLPSLVRTPEELIASNGATSTVEGLATLAGPLLGGAVASLGSVGAVFGAGAVLLVGAAVPALARVRVSDGADALPTTAGERRRGAVLAGVDVIARASRPRLLVGLGVAQAFVRGCLNVLIVVAVFQALGGGAAEVGYLTAAMGAGGLLGALGAMTLGARRLGLVFGAALVFWGLPIALMAPGPHFEAALVLLAVVGAANSVEDVACVTLLQRTVPNEVLTRVLGALWGLAMGGVALGSITAPAIVDAVGPHAAFVIVGLLLPVLTLATARGLAEIDRTTSPARELALVESVPTFAPLSVAAKERLAGSLTRVDVSPGEVVIRAGDVGDRFYVVADGELRVEATERRATMGPGDSFGEIALLRDVPRTATVTAVTDGVLYALDREHFLAAVTGHAGARQAADTVIEARLGVAGDARAG